MITAAISLKALVVALLVFGFAPGLLLRVIVLAFHRDDPRRQELRAELHSVPRVERPFWVIEQLEVALVEGIWGRIVWAATGRIIHRWHLDSGVDLHSDNPDTFRIPTPTEKDAIRPGVAVLLMFEVSRRGGEKLWVNVTDVNSERLTGEIAHTPAAVPRLHRGDIVKFKPEHVVDILWEPDAVDFEELESAYLCECCAKKYNECCEGPPPGEADPQDDGSL